ncbi:hypothetical protein Lesp02_16740 [Lentzea sp. NBRC 105346]|uniref:DUF4328 domain-containing protein n=1 Tax=Lentzea sp. NBRC 105346 TaxID=3032205 RepID=UPI0024A2E2CA|nr:DUF4328 domain-containing protein [Lentzea sp. NBRC 105346]GLZ29484.1 hypothetical protein Lesp02_16740 [Lentzea sp. NBRC 105346]
MEHFRPVRGLALAASVLIGLVALAQIGEAAVDWTIYTTVRDYRAGTATIADIRDLGPLDTLVGFPLLVLQGAAAALFITWMYRARVNAERLTYVQEHRRSRGWVIGAWFVPFANLVLPKQIADDIWRANDPLQQTVPLQQRTRHPLVTAWWGTFVPAVIFGVIYVNYTQNGQLSTGSFLRAAVFSTLSAVLGIAAAVLGVRMVRRITAMQSCPGSPATSEGPAPAA